MGNQACGGGDRKDSKPPANTSQRDNAANASNGGQAQVKLIPVAAASPERIKPRSQVLANVGEGASAAPMAQNQATQNFRKNNAEAAYYAPAPHSTGDSRVATSINQSTNGQSNPMSLSHWASLQNEASNLLMQDRNAESLLKFKEALKVQIAILGDRHPDIALTMNNLGIVSRACGKPEDSVGFFRQAAEICYEVLVSINCLHFSAGDISTAERRRVLLACAGLRPGRSAHGTGPPHAR